MLAANLMLLGASFAPPQGITNFKASEAYSSINCSALSSDGRLGFFSGGSSLTVWPISATPPCAIPEPIPLDAPVREILPYSGRIFVAGGTGGLYEVQRPASILCGTPASAFTVVKVDDFESWLAQSGGPNIGIGSNDLQCLALGVAENNPTQTQPILIALFSGTQASSNSAQVELRLYKLLASGVPEHLTTINPGITAAESRSVDIEVSTYTGGKQFVYLANGIGGVMRIDITNPLAPQVLQGPIFNQAPQLTPDGQAARATHLSLTRDSLFVAIDRAGVAKVNVLPTTAWGAGQTYWFSTLLDDQGKRTHPFRICAVRESDGDTVIAVAANTGRLDHFNNYYFNANEDYCPPAAGTVNQDPPGAESGCKNAFVYILAEKFGQQTSTITWPAPGGGQIPGPSYVTKAHLDIGEGTVVQYWRSVSLRKKTVPAGTLDYEVLGSQLLKAKRFDLTDPFGTSPVLTPNLEFRVSGTGPLDSVVSLLEPDLVMHASEASNPIGLMLINPTETVFQGIAGTSQSDASNAVCDECTIDCHEDCERFGNPFAGSIMDGAQWLDTGVLGGLPELEREWFVTGASGNIREQCEATPCLYNPNYLLATWKKQQSAGWTLTSFHPAAVASGAAAINSLRWWQMPGPSSPYVAGTATGGRYWSSHLDKRPDPNSDVLCLTRWLVPDGLTLVPRQELVDAATSQCFGGGPVGAGQFLHLDGLSLSYRWKLVTHYEHEFLPGGGLPYTGQPCTPPSGSSTPGVGKCITSRATSFDYFRVSENDTRRILAVAAGHVNNPTHPEVRWRSRLNLPMVVFYDITDVPSGGAPTLVRLLFGPAAGTTLNVDIVNMGPQSKPYALIDNLLGTVHVYDLSALFLPLGSDPRDPDTGIQASTVPNPLVATWTSALDRWNHVPHNVADVELEKVNSNQVRAYVANGQAGLTMVTFSGFDTGNITHTSVTHDTPVFADGLTLRPASGTPSSIVVSDTTGSGLKLFTRNP